MKRSIAPAAKLYPEDTVNFPGIPSLGIVVRCWHDADDIPIPPALALDPIMQPLQPGQVGIAFASGQRLVLPESDLNLVDRRFQPGDYCKKIQHADDVISGLITHVDVRVKVCHAISGAKVDGWRTADEFDLGSDCIVGDYVTYDGWIGQVIEVLDDISVSESSGRVVNLLELGSHFRVGDHGLDILPRGEVPGYPRLREEDTVLEVKHIMYSIMWLALSQQLSQNEAQSKRRPPHLWYGEDLAKLHLIRGESEHRLLRPGDRIHFKDPSLFPQTEHRGITVKMFEVMKTQTQVTLVMQDSTVETCLSTDLVPYLNPDEYDCWPGDSLIWKSEDGERAAVVQRVNATDRVATILCTDNASLASVSLLELDVNGSENDLQSETLGVRIGDFVLIHTKGSTNGFPSPRVPSIGEVPEWAKEPPLSLDGQPANWRLEMDNLGRNLQISSGCHKIELVARGDRNMEWFGEVIGLQLDGSAVVYHMNGVTASYPLERLTRLSDGLELLEEWVESGEDAMSTDEDELNWHTDTGTWESYGLDSNRSISDSDAEDARTPTTLVDQQTTQGSVLSEEEAVQAGVQDNPWIQFEVLPSVSADHAFFSSPPPQISRGFMNRLHREYKILANSLPESILVRAYEDRSDLLRSVIIGPENTPYADAPFVIDFSLDGFPQQPPKAHFFSWTNGNGRVNPNLYEEGKICLSILNTWKSEQEGEGWNSTSSSLLQVLVSIQGLILVQEPWFCEPAYAKLKGTADGTVNSRLYSEKAYVLARGFIRRALENPLSGIDTSLKWLYYDQQRLKKAINDARALIARSRSPNPEDTMDNWDDVAVPRLSLGGCMTLGRTLDKLQQLLDKHDRAIS